MLPYVLVVSSLVAAVLSSPAPILVPARAAVQPVSVREPLDSSIVPHSVDKRLSESFSLDRQWNHDVLFAGSWSNAGLEDSEKVSLSVTCVECWTKGDVTASLTTEDIFEPVVRLDFRGVEAYVDIEVKTSAKATYSINLFSTENPLGLSLPDLDIGVMFHVDLVFSVDAIIDLEGGFHIALADDAYLEAAIFGGDIKDSFFDGIRSRSIPVTVHSGSATFKADLRLRVQCGAEAEVDLLGIGAGAMVGIYANLIEFVAELDATAPCGLEAQEFFDLNVGAYAMLDVEVDYKSYTLAPSISTTLFKSPTFTQCWNAGSPEKSGAPPALGHVSGGGSGGIGAGTSSLVVQTQSSESRHKTYSAASAIVATRTSSSSPASYTDSTTQPSYGKGLSSTPAITPTPGYSLTPTGLVTSTVYITTEYTVTSCGCHVINCPASWQQEVTVTRTIDAFTTVCPYGAKITAPSDSVETTTRTFNPSAAQGPGDRLSKISPVTSTFVAPPLSKSTSISEAKTQEPPSSQQEVSAPVNFQEATVSVYHTVTLAESATQTPVRSTGNYVVPTPIPTPTSIVSAGNKLSNFGIVSTVLLAMTLTLIM